MVLHIKIYNRYLFSWFPPISKSLLTYLQANHILHVSDNNIVKKEEQIIEDMFTIRQNSLQTKKNPQLINVCQEL